MCKNHDPMLQLNTASYRTTGLVAFLPNPTFSHYNHCNKPPKTSLPYCICRQCYTDCILTNIYINLLNIWKFVYFVCGLSPPKRRIIRWRYFVHRRVTTTYRTCWVLCYQNNNIFLKLHKCRPRLCCSDGSVARPWSVLGHVAGLLAGWP